MSTKEGNKVNLKNLYLYILQYTCKSYNHIIMLHILAILTIKMLLSTAGKGRKVDLS